MDPDQWRQISHVYHEASGRPADERRAFLKAECGSDDALRREVESLLADDTRAEAFLAAPAAEAFSAEIASDSKAVPGIADPGMTLGNYRIDRLLGRGGMGTVYLALDTTLHRLVALKLMTGPADDGTLRARLMREARNAAALNHPNICTIHEVGDAKGSAFIAMEYVEGRSLRDRLDEGALPLEEALHYGIQAAEALAYAHDRGVIHRDLKAANVMVTDAGRLKVVDFGLARRDDALMASATTMASLVPAGAAAGTPYAMAPEQVRGESADSRTDIWALGVLLYEMVTGAQPFKAATTAELFSSILRDPPAPLPDAVPVEMRALIERCLQNEREQRYPHAAEVRDALDAIKAGRVAPWVGWRYHLNRRRWLVSAAALAGVAAVLVGLDVGGARERLRGRPSVQAPIKVAVLPFKNLTGDPGQEYFSDGLTDEMITQLGRLHPERLIVIARTSSMRYKNRDMPIGQIGRDLGVDYLMEGSARREGSRVRVNASLVQVRDQTQLWADSFERELTGILALQSDIARGVAGSLALTLLPTQQHRLADSRPVNPEAYEAYLKGMQHFYRLTPQEMDTAQQYFELALRTDPNYAVAHAGIAEVWSGRLQMSFVPWSEAAPKVIQAARKALELDTSVPQAHYAMGIARWYEGNWAECEREWQLALDLNPNYAGARAPYSHLLNILKRPQAARTQIDRALQVDPYNAFLQAFNGTNLLFERRWDDAIDQLRTALKMSPGLPLAANPLIAALHMKGSYAEALDALKTYAEIMGYTEVEQRLQRRRAGDDYRQAMRQAADALVARSQRTYVSRYDIVMFYTYAGELDRAFEWIDKAIENRDPNLPYLLEPDFEPLHGDARFRAVMGRLNLSS